MTNITNTEILMAVLASCGGCAIRYGELYKNLNRFKLSFFLIDLFIASFLGFFVFWFVTEENICSLTYAMLTNCLVGFLGSKVFDIASYFLYMKFGIDIKFIPKEENRNDSKRNPL